MTVQDWSQYASSRLQIAGVATARLDALVILADVTDHDKGYILAHPEYQLTSDQLKKINNLLSRRVLHEPLSYLRGMVEFYGRDFMVGPGVLVPRPESEALIGLLLGLFAGFVIDGNTPPDGRRWRLADVGTGSGALGITAQLELPETAVALLEIDESAIEVAKRNVINLSTTTPIIKTDLLAGVADKFNILLCNLPYVPDSYPINKAAGFEPPIAIFGGFDGLGLYRRMFQQIKIVENKPLYILTESLPASHQALIAVAADAGYALASTADFAQLFHLERVRLCVGKGGIC